MRFEPRIVQPEEAPLAAADEHELPPELTALAWQLGDDAERLSGIYPPHREANFAEQGSSGTRRRLFLPGVSAALLLIAGSVAWRALPSAGQTARARSAPVIAAATNTATNGQPVAAAAWAKVSVAELSGAELEALIDLVGHEAESPVSVSF